MCRDEAIVHYLFKKDDSPLIVLWLCSLSNESLGVDI